MGNWLTIAIFILNAFSILMSFKMLKGFDKTKSVVYVVISETIMFIICFVLYGFTGGNISPEIHQKAQWLIIFTMFPINVIAISCPILGQINKRSIDEANESSFKKRAIFICIIAIIIFVIEIAYINGIQEGIAKFTNT